jgi:hypothetical protein
MESQCEDGFLATLRDRLSVSVELGLRSEGSDCQRGKALRSYNVSVHTRQLAFRTLWGLDCYNCRVCNTAQCEASLGV